MTRTAKPLRRIVTGHNQQGHAIFRSTDTLQPEVIASGDAEFATIWSTAEVPANLNDERDGSEREVGLTINNGSVIRAVDFLPSGVSPMHRTNSIDYGIVVSGEIELELDNGAIETCRAGDVIVQRGTIHLWRNISDTEVCRVIFVLTAAQGPYLHDGKSLEEIKP